jgi:hypothetical protein
MTFDDIQALDDTARIWPLRNTALGISGSARRMDGSICMMPPCSVGLSRIQQTNQIRNTPPPGTVSMARLMLSLVIAVLLLSAWCLAAHAATFYVATTGSNAVTCAQAQSRSTPRRTINQGIACLRSGDTLIVGNGTYDEIITDYAGQGGYAVRPPSGSSLSNMTLIKAENVYGAILAPSAGRHPGNIVLLDLADTQYLQLEGFILDGQHNTTGVSNVIALGAQRLRFVNIWSRNGMQGYQGPGTDIEIIGGKSTGHGFSASGADICTGSGVGTFPGFCHGIYGGHGAARWFIDGMELAHNSGYGLQAYPSDTTIRNSYIHDNLSSGIVAIGSNFTAYNNVVVRNCGGISMAHGTNVAIGNTVTNQAPSSLCQNGYPFGIKTSSPASTTIKNNLLTNIPDAGFAGYIYGEGGTGATGNSYADHGVHSALVAGNMCDKNTMVGCTAVSAGSCFFVGTTTNDYHLCSASPARNAGMSLGSPYNVDKDGIARSTTGAVDIGAYQYGSGTSTLPLPAPSNLRATVQ